MASFGAGFMCAVLVLCFAVPSMATVYTVGDAMDWRTNVDYTPWVHGKTFIVGDSLVFNYRSGHTVDEVSASDYTTCTVGNAIASANSGSTTILLTTPGTRYFICGLMGHCGIGMKLAVTVEAGATTLPPGTPSSGTTLPLPPPTVYMTFSSSRTLSPFVALLITWVALLVLLLS